MERINKMDELAMKYLEVFGELPKLPVLVNMSLIADLMQDAIVSKIPVSQEDINKRFEEMDEKVDLS